MNCGLCAKELEIIQEILSRYEAIQSAVLFGSSVTGNFKTASDIDIALKGAITIKLIAKIKAEFEDSNLPFFVDIVDYAKADNALKNEIDTQGVMLYPHFKVTTTTWQRVKLGEVAEILSSKRIFYSEYVKFGIPFYRSKEIIDKALKKPLNECLYISYDRFNEIKEKYGVPINGDILISAVGERSGIAYLVNNDGDFYFKDGNLIWLKNFSNNLNGKYLVYWFQSRIGQSILENIMIGSAQKALTIQGMKELVLDIPPIETQRKIAEILSSLDDKIDLLHRQNKTLESLALTLFRHTFIDNPKRNAWQIGKLGDYIEIFDNKRIPLSKLQRDKMKTGTLYPYYGAANIMDYVNDFIFDGAYILMGEDGTVETEDGYPILQYASGKFWVNNHAHIFKAKAPYNDFFILNFLKQTNISHIVTGAVQPKINQENLKSIPFCKYPIELVSWFIEATNTYFDKINANKKQIQNLQSMRDMLLSKILNENS